MPTNPITDALDACRAAGVPVVWNDGTGAFLGNVTVGVNAVDERLDKAVRKACGDEPYRLSLDTTDAHDLTCAAIRRGLRSIGLRGYQCELYLGHETADGHETYWVSINGCNFKGHGDTELAALTQAVKGMKL